METIAGYIYQLRMIYRYE